MIDTILGVAVRRPSGVVVRLPAPARLADVLAWLDETGHGGEWAAECEQGFYSVQEAFLGRPAALALARSNGQLQGRPRGAELSDEDLW